MVLLGWWCNIGCFIDRVKLATLDRVEEEIGGFLNALEEVVIFGGTGGSSLIGVMLQDLLSVCLLDLVFGCLVSVFTETENGVVILVLFVKC